MDFLKGLRPTISFDSLTGAPEVTIDFAESRQYEQSLTGLFSFVEKQNIPVVIAMDEFQQIANYPEKNVEAILRSIIQKLHNIQFIFCGSSKHLLSEIFTDSQRPFFSSTQPLNLESIDKKEYTAFIKNHFSKAKRLINDEAIDFVLEWTRLHTYYTQVVCNKLYASEKQKITLDDVKFNCDAILMEQENIFFQYRNLLTSGQWNLLKAIAKEDKVYKPSSKSFIKRYDLGTPSHIQRALSALFEKEMIFLEQDVAGGYYRVYDCFLARWLERL